MTQTSKPLPIQLYQFKDFDFDAFYEQYINEITPHETIDENTLSVFTPAKTKLTKAKSGAKDKTVIEYKIKYLQDVIIRIANRKQGDNTFSLNAEILKSVIGKEYKTLIEVLIEMGYLSFGDNQGGEGKYYYYEVGKYSMLYTLNDTKEVYLTTPFVNLKIQEYKNKTIERVREQYETYTKPQIINLYGEPFLTSYLRSLNKITIEDEQGLKAYIHQRTLDNFNSNPYYNYIYIELKNKNKSIYRIDSSHRIYHILTNLERNVKKYLNIKLSIDCKNSHPLLFNYFIFNKLNISISKSYIISSFIKSIDISSISISNISFHNVGQYLRKLLIDNNIEIEEVAKMKDDELEYVYKTSKGLLWDEICEAHPELDRKEVKVAMFGAVFYAHSPVADRWNDYAKEFKSHYPSVYKLIGNWKRKKTSEEVVEYMAAHHLPTKKASASLSIAMMALEADIFTTILKHLYSKRWNALHIHDCIIVPKTNNKNQPTQDEVLAIMEDVFKLFGLSPTFDCE